MVEIATVGVYGWDADRFFRALQEARVDLLCDIRRRRGVRGAEYAFANSQRLQARLAELGIAYLHRLDLAPSAAVRQTQQTVDEAGKVAKRQRQTLSPAFVDAYQQDVLAGFDARQFAGELGDARVVALLCVEGDAAACHRSLLADRLARDLDLPVRHLPPPDRQPAGDT